MAAPITWRNVNTGGDGGGRLLANAANAFGNSTNTLLNVLQDQQRQAQAADKQITESNTQDYADKVVQMVGGDPTKLADPTVQANVEKLRLSYGNNIDREKARQYVPALLADAQKVQENTWKFNQQQRQEQQRPLLDQLYGLVGQGKTAEATKLADENDFGDQEAGVRQFITRAADDAQQRVYRANGESRAVEDQSMQRQSFATQQANAALSRQNLQQSLDFGKRDQTMQETTFSNQQADRLDTKLTNQAKELGQVADSAVKAQQAKTEQASKTNPFIITNKEEATEASNKLLKGITEGKYDSSSPFTFDTTDRQAIQKNIIQKLDPDSGLSFTDKDGVTYRAPASPQLLQQALDATSSEYKLSGGSAAAHIDEYFKRRLADPTDPIRAQIIDAQKALQEKAQVEAWAQQLKGNAAQLLIKKAGAVKIDPNILRKIGKFGKPDPDDDIDDSKTSPY